MVLRAEHLRKNGKKRHFTSAGSGWLAVVGLLKPRLARRLLNLAQPTPPISSPYSLAAKETKCFKTSNWQTILRILFANKKITPKNCQRLNLTRPTPLLLPPPWLAIETETL